MNARILLAADHLLLLERELRALNLWSQTAPSADKLESGVPFGVGVIEFEQWLQWVFIAKIKVLLEQGSELPSISGIQPMAEEYYKHDLKRFASLIELLGEIDQNLGSK